ncbi:geranylgeranyl diphosphate synthase, type II [Seinonella peptonophila]|uniref:Farnesyl diphosphate synthase n=1 Tax=Seinonella peptonophila TaxID=112248 RepID=A0A1M4TM87_9BACL|nr:farnesyl diphosphate synthase [Seinonella peptonophila]SHE45494.1 geranylgeranyl diphosphate synthase, type II [Seinonella peptonophila]
MIETYIHEKGKIIETKLEDYLNHYREVPDRLYQSMKYSLMAGGKRLRPILVLATVEACDKPEELAYPLACAIEMIHTYSLIHDDLPCMDDDDYRRGKLTNHKKFDEATAVLAGDALLTEAFTLMSKGVRAAKLSFDDSLAIIEETAKHAGAFGMIGGQMDDLLSEDKQITVEELEAIHRRKTGDLIAFSVRTGARIGGASEEALTSLTQFAYRLGLAFQIQDDILDIIGDPELIGKPVGSDQENLKSTYPSLLGLEESQQLLARLTYTAKEELLKTTELNPQRLLDIADYLLTRKR